MTIILVYLAFLGSPMVEDNYMCNKLESSTITRDKSIIFETGNINSSVVVLSTKSVILGNFSNCTYLTMPTQEVSECF